MHIVVDVIGKREKETDIIVISVGDVTKWPMCICCIELCAKYFK